MLFINSSNIINTIMGKRLNLFRALFLVCSLHCSTDGTRIVWKNHIKISSDHSSDLERIPARLISSLNLQVDDDKFERLHKLARSQPQVGSEYQNIQLVEYDYQFDYG